MANYNKVIIMGNLTRDPEYKQLPSGQAICKLGLASNRQFKNRQTDSMIQEVCFVDIDVWGPQAESCRQYLQKGRPVLVEGRLKFDSWQENNGQKRSKHTIVAERVLFLYSQSEDSQQVSELKEKPKSEVDAQLEKDLLDQIDEIKERTAKPAKKEAVKQEKEKEVQPAKKAESKDASVLAKATPDKPAAEEKSAGDVAFKDQPPFEDDLPF